MSKPSTTYPFATNPGVTTDPGATRQGTGFVAGKKAPSKWFNWLHKGAHLWFEYLNNLHNETEFLAQDYSWTGQHKVDQDINYDSARLFTRILDLQPARPAEASLSAVTWSGEKWRWSPGTASGSWLYIPVPLPSSAFIADVDLLVEATTGHTVTALLRRTPMNFDAATISATITMRTVSGGSLVNGLTTVDVPAAVGQSQLINRDVNAIDLAVSIENGGTPAQSFLRGVRVKYEMNGYRNG